MSRTIRGNPGGGRDYGKKDYSEVAKCSGYRLRPSKKRKISIKKLSRRMRRRTLDKRIDLDYTM